MGLAAVGAVFAFKGRETAWQVDTPRPITPLVGIWINLPLAVLSGLFWRLVTNLRM